MTLDQPHPDHSLPSTTPFAIIRVNKLHLQTPFVLGLHGCTFMACKCISFPMQLRPPSSSLSALNFRLQIRLHTRSITASKDISKLTQSQPSSASANLLQYGLHVCTMMASQVGLETGSISASKCARSWLPIAYPFSHDYGLQVLLSVHSIAGSKCISTVALLWPAGASLSPLNLSLQVHLQTRSIMDSMWISKLTQSQPPNASLSPLNLGLQMHLHTPSITASRCISKFTQSQPPSTSPNSLHYGFQVCTIMYSKCISIPARLCPSSASPTSHQHGL